VRWSGNERSLPAHEKSADSRQSCLKCKRRIDGATGVSSTDPRPEPEPGNLAICLYCGALNRYDKALHVVPVPREERRAILRRNPKLKELLEILEAAAQQIRREWQ